MDKNTENVIRVFVIRELLQLDENKINDDMDLLMLGLDSLRMMRLVNYLEQHLNIRLKDEDVIPENLQTVRKIHQLITNY